VSRVLALVVALGAVGCVRGLPYTVVAEEQVPAPPLPTQAEWVEASALWRRLREGAPRRPYVERIRLRVKDPRTGKLVQVRGAVAVHPGKAARMLLVGPGGTTAVDLWVTPERWRVSIPAAQIERRGGRDLDDALGLPIGFARWWLLAPVEGELIFAQSSGVGGKGKKLWFRTSANGVVTIDAPGEFLVATRRAPDGRRDSVIWPSASPSPSAPLEASYHDLTLGLTVDVAIEAVMPDEPDPAAFVDPDAPGAP